MLHKSNINTIDYVEGSGVSKYFTYEEMNRKLDEMMGIIVFYLFTFDQETIKKIIQHCLR